MLKRIMINFNKYKYLLIQLISRDFKVKYKRSVLGVLWSILYPLLTMSVLALVFTNIFKADIPGVSYLVYLLSGLVIFNFFSEATNLAMSSVVANFSLINKVYIPKYIFPLSKILFVGINFLLTLIPLYIMIIITGTSITVYHLLLPFMFIFMLMFIIGFGLILSTIAVFLRDMFYIYGIIITLWMYLTPIMYPINLIPAKFLFIFKLNPLYHFINFGREIILYGNMPSVMNWLSCFVFGSVFLIIGLLVFKKNQDKFIYFV